MKFKKTDVVKTLAIVSKTLGKFVPYKEKVKEFLSDKHKVAGVLGSTASVSLLVAGVITSPMVAAAAVTAITYDCFSMAFDRNTEEGFREWLEKNRNNFEDLSKFKKGLHKYESYINKNFIEPANKQKPTFFQYAKKQFGKSLMPHHFKMETGGTMYTGVGLFILMSSTISRDFMPFEAARSITIIAASAWLTLAPENPKESESNKLPKVYNEIANKAQALQKNLVFTSPTETKELGLVGRVGKSIRNIIAGHIGNRLESPKNVATDVFNIALVPGGIHALISEPQESKKAAVARGVHITLGAVANIMHALGNREHAKLEKNNGEIQR
jgi:hypothetical protein